MYCKLLINKQFPISASSKKIVVKAVYEEYTGSQIQVLWGRLCLHVFIYRTIRSY